MSWGALIVIKVKIRIALSPDFNKSNITIETDFVIFRLDMAFTVRDYIRGGCSFRFMVAVDFTVSTNT